MPEINKYRPALTATELHYILATLKNVSIKAGTEDPVADSLIKKLSVFCFKLGIGAISPSHSETLKPTLEEKLGLTSTPAERRKAAYDKVLAGSANAADLALAATYMYDNNLMNEQQRKDYELKYFE
jgi:hypothetical protein